MVDKPSSTQDSFKIAIWVLFFAVVFGSVTLIYPFGKDQGIHAFTAYQWLQGKMVYRDIFNIKPPMTPPTHLLALVLFGHAMTSIRILDLLLHCFTCLLLSKIAYTIFRKPWIAISVCALFSFSYFSINFWDISQTDGWINLPATLSMFFLLNLKKKESNFIAFSVGFFIGIAFLYKYTIGLLLPFSCLYYLFFLEEKREKIFKPIVITAGFLCSVGLMTLYLYFENALSGFIESQTLFTSIYLELKEKNILISFIKPFFNEFNGSLAMIFISTVLGILALFHKIMKIPLGSSDKSQIFFCISWFIAALISLFVQRKFFGYHYLPLLPPMALLSGYFFVHIDSLFPQKWVHTHVKVVILVSISIGIFFTSNYPRKFQNLYSILAKKTSLDQYWRKPGRFGLGITSLADNLLLSDFLKENTQSSDRVNIWGFEPLVNFVSKRNITTRFPFNFPCEPQYGIPKYQEEYLESFKKDPPEYFVLQRGDAMPEAKGHAFDSYQSFLMFFELSNFVKLHYKLISKVGNVGIISDDQKFNSPRFYVFKKHEKSMGGSNIPKTED